MSPLTALGHETRPRLLQEFVEIAAERARVTSIDGTVSSQVPRLSSVPATRLAVAVATVDGELVSSGDGDLPFSLQSVTKLFALCALLRHEPAAWDHVGWVRASAGYKEIGRDRQTDVEHDRLRTAQDPVRQDHAPTPPRRRRKPHRRRRHHPRRLDRHGRHLRRYEHQQRRRIKDTEHE